jgi:hypothetical protein
MTSCNRLDPLAFAGSFAYLESDLPPGVTLSDWRLLRTRSAGAGVPATRADLDAGLAPEDRTPLGGADEGASAAQRARPQPEEGSVNTQQISELLRGAAPARERRQALRRLGREGRLAAYRRGEFNLETCCMWAAAYPREVPLLNGEFEFIAATTPEVCER